MAYDRQQVIDFLRRLGYSQAADDAARELPSKVSKEQVWEFNDRHRIILDELIDWMGGSPLAVTQPSSLRGWRTATDRTSTTVGKEQQTCCPRWAWRPSRHQPAGVVAQSHLRRPDAGRTGRRSEN